MAEEPGDGEPPDRPQGTDASDESSDSEATNEPPASDAADGSPEAASSTDDPDDTSIDRDVETDEDRDTVAAAEEGDDDTAAAAEEADVDESAIGGADDVAEDPLRDVGDDHVAVAPDDPVAPVADDPGAADDDPDVDLDEAYGVSGADVDTPPARPEHAEPDPPASDGGYAGERSHADYAIDETTVHDGAPDDREMPLADHIEEMVKRLGVVVVVMAVVSGLVFPFGEDLINFLWYSYLPGTAAQCPEAAATAQDLGPNDAACPRVYHPLAVVLARLKVATLAGFIVALPVFVYETYLFMRPGLYPTERRYYLASVPTSLVLAMVGVAFAHFLVIPALFTYFVYYSDNATTIAFGLAETFDLMVLLMGGFAIIFQIPLFIMLALMMGLVTRRWMIDRRLIFWGVFAGLAFLFSPDPTGMAPIIVAATMIALFEGTLLLARWTGKE